MIVQYYKSIYDKFTNHQTDWDKIKYYVANPATRYTSKSDVPLWSFYVPRKDLQPNEAGEYTGNGDNMEYCYALMVDYDDGVKIDDFIDKFPTMKYLLYTSFRSCDELNKFRVIIPLAKPLDNKYMKSPVNKNILLEMFDGCDKSTINVFRKQKIPALDPANPQNYRYHINTTGDLLTINHDLFHDNWVESQKKPESRYRHNDHRYTQIKGLFVPKELDVAECTELACRKQMRDINFYKRGTGNVHFQLCQIYGKMKKVGFDSYYITSMMCEYASNDAYNEIEQIGRSLR